MVCPQCKDGQLLAGEPVGQILADYQGAYFTPGPENCSQKRAVLLLTDAFGMGLKNCKLIADDFAKRVGCDVWIPDYFDGRPLINPSSLELPDKPFERPSIFEWLKFIITIGIPSIPSIIHSRPSFIDLIKTQKKYERLGAVGYCFGGSTCVRFGSSDKIQSIVICHPGRFTLDEVKAIKIPTAWVCAEDDMFFPDSLRDQSEAVFAARKGKDHYNEYEFQHYKGTTHGFASRPNLENPEVKVAFEGACNQIVNWFSKTLPA
ncbi:hypothetical protein CVT24_012895 [Panaeolus cyanescens]|uniref:Dienelactone hydrolase domain-containing protein n=1 Tax=Panaeolus cyanescens TaxID=181874 RepID=A0A409W2S2_9AGAR|nr:hypothetical protein CVT24_012895 [Panaeolus cyanescens]